MEPKRLTDDEIRAIREYVYKWEPATDPAPLEAARALLSHVDVLAGELAEMRGTLWDIMNLWQTQVDWPQAPETPNVEARITGQWEDYGYWQGCREAANLARRALDGGAK